MVFFPCFSYKHHNVLQSRSAVNETEQEDGNDALSLTRLRRSNFSTFRSCLRRAGMSVFGQTGHFQPVEIMTGMPQEETFRKTKACTTAGLLKLWIRVLFRYYACTFRPAEPINSIRPEPNKQTAVGVEVEEKWAPQ